MPPEPIKAGMTGDAEVVANLAINMVDNLTHKGMALIPAGSHLLNLERTMLTPLRKRGTANLSDTDSFCRYVLDHFCDDSRIYESGSKFTCVLDAHKASHIHDEGARWGEFRAELLLTASPEWQVWIAGNNRIMTQKDFAQFIQDNDRDIKNAAEMLEMALKFEVSQHVSYKKAVRLDNGDTSLHYENTSDAKSGQKGDTVIPPEFTILVPVFLGSKPLEITCRLRYKLSGDALSMSYQIPYYHRIMEAALTVERGIIANSIKLPMFKGSPPSFNSNINDPNYIS